MLEAFMWGLISASALLIGALLAMRFSFSQRALGLVMAFASGVLISAVAYELVLDAVEDHSPQGAALGLAAGALTFFIGDVFISKSGGEERKSSIQGASKTSAMAIVLGIVLDGVPESAVLGLTLIEGSVSLTMLAAVFISNLPEALAATTGLRKEGWETGKLLQLWGGVAVVSSVASAAGYGLFSGASPATVAFVLAFAAGAILTMLADTMMPEAFRDAGPVVGLVTTLGFALAFSIQSLE
jgi:ZIP family zinc transporter